jgi:hypothetical protein
MSSIIILDTEYITVQYLADKKLIWHTIHKPIPDEPLIEALNAGSDALIKYGATKWLSDDRKNGPVSTKVVEWGLRGWAPRTIEGGWKYWANVLPEVAGTMMPIIDSLYEMGLKMLLFTDAEKALAWLDSIKD